MKYVHIFHNDLSLTDNNIITSTIKKYKPTEIIFLMILNKYQLLRNDTNKNYYSPIAALFFLDAVQNLANEIKTLNLGKLICEENINDFLIKTKDISIVSYNKLFSEYSIKRDEEYKKIFKQYNKDVIIIEDIDYYTTLLTPIDNTPKYYKVFSAFYKYYCRTNNKIKINYDERTYYDKIKTIDKQVETICKKIENKIIGNDRLLIEYQQKYRLPATKQQVLKLIGNFLQNKEQTLGSMLSRYIALNIGGSIRFYYNVLKDFKPDFCKQLYWRTFYFHLQRNNINLGSFSYHTLYKELDPRYLKIKWENNDFLAESLWIGRCGYPYLDAHIHMCIKTGFMTNFGRLNVMCVAIKVLCYNPYDNTKYWSGLNSFSRMLIDTHGAAAMLNIAWVLSLLDTGFSRFNKPGHINGRVFKSAITPKKIEEDLHIIREFLPELKDVSDYDVCHFHNYSPKKRKALAPEYKSMNKQNPYQATFDYEERIKIWLDATKIN